MGIWELKTPFKSNKLYARYMPDICQIYARYMPDICQINNNNNNIYCSILNSH